MGCSSTKNLANSYTEPPKVIVKESYKLELIPANWLQPCELVYFKGDTWKDVYYFAIDLQKMLHSCALSKNFLIDYIKRHQNFMKSDKKN